MNNLIGILSLSVGLVVTGVTSSYAQSTTELAQKALRAASVLEEIESIPDKSIPISLLKNSTCIATFPDVVKAGFIFGGRLGTGIVSCRVPSGWSKPSYLKITGGSWGFQIGIEAVDTVLVFVNTNAVQRLSVNNFTLGGDISVAIGPVGRDLQAGTDYQLGSEIYSYSRARGLFAGVSLERTSVSVEVKSNHEVYGEALTASYILTSSGLGAPEIVMPYLIALQKIAP